MTRLKYLPLLCLGLVHCSVDSAKSRYVLAEKLWTDGKYAASVSEFEKVVARDPNGKLGLQALQRAAMTQSLYLSQYNDAVRKFRTYVELAGDTPSSWEAQKQIGEILFSKTDQYDQAIQHYQMLLKAKPEASESSEFLYRIGKAHFFLWQFPEAVATYREIIRKFPGSPVAEKSEYEIGVTYLTAGERKADDRKGKGGEAQKAAMSAFQEFIRHFPQSPLVPQAQFGIASCLEALDQLDVAYQKYEALLPTYPSPNVIRIKLARIRQRKLQRSR